MLGVQHRHVGAVGVKPEGPVVRLRRNRQHRRKTVMTRLYAFAEDLEFKAATIIKGDVKVPTRARYRAAVLKLNRLCFGMTHELNKEPERVIARPCDF